MPVKNVNILPKGIIYLKNAIYIKNHWMLHSSTSRTKQPSVNIYIVRLRYSTIKNTRGQCHWHLSVPDFFFFFFLPDSAAFIRCCSCLRWSNTCWETLVLSKSSFNWSNIISTLPMSLLFCSSGIYSYWDTEQLCSNFKTHRKTDYLQNL